MIINVERFISQSLSPAFVLSAITLMTVSIHNRVLTISARVRELNKEARTEVCELRLAEARKQVEFFFFRLENLRQGLFLLYAAMALTIFTAIAIALQELHLFPEKFNIPVWSFLLALVLVLTSVFKEAESVALNYKSLEVDSSSLLNATVPDLEELTTQETKDDK